jgi:DNA polymerase III delta prime subunit
MTNFDFHNLLFPTEFERFCLDILRVIEPDLEFRTFGGWKDNGIDMLCTSDNKNIIGQCKLYNPNNYNSLKSSLKKEVRKCKKLNPERYILFSSITFGVDQFNEVEKLFEGYLNKKDIIDSEKLNEFLRDENRFGHLFKAYSKLLVPNLSSIELALEKIIHKKYFNKTKVFFDEISSRHKLFHNTEQLPYLIQKLEDDKVIILTGNPGVGKTTMAMMIANYFFNRKKCDVIYLEERDYPDALSLANEDRLIIVDDFWGQNFSPSMKNHSTYQRELQSIIKYFTHSSNSYLILVSRDYVIKDALTTAEYETETILNENKHIINISKFTFEDRIRIFINHLLFYDYDLSYISRIKYDDNFEYLLSHPNYSPRHLDFFIKTYLNEGHQSAYAFYKSLEDYLDNPVTFWTDAFEKLNPTSRLILLVLLTSSDPMDIEDLRLSFNAIQIEARQSLNVEIVPLDFQKELIKLEEFYISIDEERYYDRTSIKFQSPGIKDYILEFLRTNGYLWIKPIISNASFFNQLTFIFSTKDEEEKISDYESDICLYGKKIKLDDNLRKVVKQKLLSEFDNLQFSNYDGREFSDQLTKFDLAEDTKYLKLLDLNRIFNTELPENNDVKRFITEQVLIDIEKFEGQGKVVSHRSMMYFPNVIELVFPDLNIPARTIIEIYYNGITFASEYEYFYKFSEIFPVKFHEFYNPKIQQIKKHIEELLFEDIEYYLEEDDMQIGPELDVLLHVTIEDLAKIYGIKITKKFVNDLESAFDMNFSFLLKEKKATNSKAAKIEQKEFRNRYTPKPYESIVDEYLPSEEDMYNPISFLKEQNYFKYIEEVKNDESFLSKLKDCRLLFEEMCHFFIYNDIPIKAIDTYRLIDLYFEHYSKQINVESQLLVNFYYQVLQELEQSNCYCTTKSKLNSILKNCTLTELGIEKLSPIIVPQKNWFKFGSSIFKNYILTRYIYAITDDSHFKERIIDISIDEPCDNDVLSFLQTLDKKRLFEQYIIPELNRLVEHIDFTNERTKALSFIKFFDIDFDLDWNKKEKTFDTSSSSCSESHFENILSFSNIEFYTSDFETYFEEEYQGESTVSRLNINTKIVKKLKQAVLETIEPKNRQSFITGEPVSLFEIKLSSFLQKEKNYQIAREIGIIDYIDQIIEKILACKNSYTDAQDPKTDQAGFLRGRVFKHRF